MTEREKITKRRIKGIFAILLCAALVIGWLQMPGEVQAATSVFPQSTVSRTIESDDVATEETEETEEPEEIEEIEEIGSGSVIIPTTPAKGAGHVSVTLDDYIYGGASATPQVVSNTGDIQTVVLTYKITGADDSTYSAQMPTEVGNYTVQAVLPEDSKHTGAVATDTFTISYLSAPSPAYVLDGTLGDNGWYKSEVVITPPEGYEMSVGNRSNFSSEGYKVSEETTGLRFYLKKTATGEMTDVITIANLRIDTTAPELKDMQDGEEYYEDVINIDFTENNFKTATVDGKLVEVTSDEEGNHSFAIETGIRRLTYVLVLTDEAGNETKVSFILGPAWLKDGIVGEGNYYLETGEEYHFPAGDDWEKAGDNTVYAGGSSFYANTEGEVTFRKE